MFTGRRSVTVSMERDKINQGTRGGVSQMSKLTHDTSLAVKQPN